MSGVHRCASTLWRTAAGHKNLTYYYENTASPGILWVRLKQIDFSPTSGTRKLATSENLDLVGDQTANFTPAQPFQFLTPGSH